MIKILVVDDDAKLNQDICAYLNSSGYEAMYGSLYSLIISDIMMLGTDGFEFANTVRGLDRSIPILFMSARDDLSAKQRGFGPGASL